MAGGGARQSNSALQHGVVVKWDAERGYGFIRPQNGRGGASGERDVFVHLRNVSGHQALMPGQPVTYHLVKTDKGPAAMDVRAGSKLSTPYVKYALVGLGSALVLLLFLSQVLGSIGSLGLWLALWVLSTSLVAFGVYGYDKAQAQAGGGRVPELVLHGLSLAGGSPGAFAAMRLFHHKTSKGSFQAVFWLIVAAQIGGLAYLLLRG